MRALRLILIAFVFLLQTGLASAASVRSCCLDQDCPVAQCLHMGCVASVAPAAVDTAPRPALLAAREWVQPAGTPALPSPLKEIWTPPD